MLSHCENEKILLNCLCATKHRINTYDEYLSLASIIMFPFGLDHQALNVSRDRNPATIYSLVGKSCEIGIFLIRLHCLYFGHSSS